MKKKRNFKLPSYLTSTFLFKNYRKDYLQKIKLLLGNNILANEQFGFREKSTTDMVTHALLNDIQLSLDKKWL